MKYIEKKISMLALCIMTILFLSGCNAETPDSIALNIVKKLSRGDYSFSEYIDLSNYNKDFFKELNMEEIIKYKKMDIEGNKKYTVTYNDCSKNSNNNDTTLSCTIKVGIDNNKNCVFNMIKIDNKWKINADYYFKSTSGITIDTIDGSKVFLNDQEIPDEYKRSNGSNGSSVINGFNVNKYIYTIKDLPIQSYKLKVILDGAEPIENKVYLEEAKKNFTKTENIEIDNLGYYSINFKPENEEKIKNYATKAIEDVLNNIKSGSEINNIEKYFKNQESVKSTYDYNMTNTKRVEPDNLWTTNYYIYNIAVNNMTVEDIIVTKPNTFGVKINYKLSYDLETLHVSNYSDLNKVNHNDKNIEAYLLIENTNNNLEIINSKNFVPKMF